MRKKATELSELSVDTYCRCFQLIFTRVTLVVGRSREVHELCVGGLAIREAVLRRERSEAGSLGMRKRENSGEDWQITGSPTRLR
jgi:hypothetical protein